MKKLLLAMLIIAVAMPAFASETRVRALGPMTAPFIQDDSNVFMWPATLVGYANLVTMTAGYVNVLSGDDNGWYGIDMTARFGLTYGLGEDNRFGVFGIWWQENSPGPNSPYGVWYGPVGYTDFSGPLLNKWNVMWALAFETVDIGIRIERADEGTYNDVDGDKSEYYTSYQTLGLGPAWEFSDAANLDLAFDYISVGYTAKDMGVDEPTVEVDSKSIMAFRARMFYEWTDVITWVPYFNYKFGDLSLKSSESGFYPDTECWGFKGFQFDLGLAANINVNDDNLIIVGIEPYGLYKGEPSDCGSDAGSEEEKLTILPGFVFGLESDVKDWLTFRVGCSKALVKYDYKLEATGTKTETKETWAPFEWQLGLGFHVGDFDIDLLVNKEVPFSMGYWMTGYQPFNNEAPIGMISATYSF